MSKRIVHGSVNARGGGAVTTSARTVTGFCGGSAEALTVTSSVPAPVIAQGI